MDGWFVLVLLFFFADLFVCSTYFYVVSWNQCFPFKPSPTNTHKFHEWHCSGLTPHIYKYTDVHSLHLPYLALDYFSFIVILFLVILHEASLLKGWVSSRPNSGVYIFHWHSRISWIFSCSGCWTCNSEQADRLLSPSSWKSLTICRSISFLYFSKYSLEFTFLPNSYNSFM